MKRAIALSWLVVCLGVSQATAVPPVIRVGQHDLPANQVQLPIEIYVSGSDLVAGFNLQAQIGNDTLPGAKPLFVETDFANGIWSAWPCEVANPGPVPNYPMLSQASVSFTESGREVRADGLLVTLMVSTLGVNSGTFDLLLRNDLAKGSVLPDSDFIGGGGASLGATIENGSINIVVPEPATPLLLSMSAIGLLAYAWRRRLLRIRVSPQQ